MSEMCFKIFLLNLHEVFSCVYLCADCVSGLLGCQDLVSKTSLISNFKLF